MERFYTKPCKMRQNAVFTRLCGTFRVAKNTNKTT